MNAALRRTLLRRWIRGVFGIAVLLAPPVLVPRLVRALDPQQERTEMAQGAERRQHAGGEVFVTPSGETRRAVVYTPAPSTASSTAPQWRAYVWWSRLLASAIALGLLTSTWRTLREERAAAPANRV